MPDRSYEGDPIDATMQYISERNGKTVAGSTEDDYGDQFTVAIPGFIDTDDLTDAEENMIQAKIVHPELAHKEIASRYNWQQSSVSSLFASLRRDYEVELKDAGLYETFKAPQDRREEPEPEREEPTRDDPGKTGEHSIGALVNDEMLFKIINGDELSRGERKQVFEAVLSDE